MVGLGHPIGHRITDTDARAHPPARACMYVCAGGVALASSSSVTPLAGTSECDETGVRGTVRHIRLCLVPWLTPLTTQRVKATCIYHQEC